MDRSVLEAKPVSELKEIAKTLDLKVSGLKKAEIIDLIAKSPNGASPPARSKPARDSAPAKPATAKPATVTRESAPPLGASESNGGSPGSSGVRDDGAIDDREHRS